jgi:hypothetical protein
MRPEASDKGSVTVQISVLEGAELPQRPLLWTKSEHWLPSLDHPVRAYQEGLRDC